MDKIYEIILVGRMMAGGTNNNVRLGPNGNFTKGGFRNIASRFYEVSGSATQDMNIRNNGAFTLGFTDWSADGDMFIDAKLMAQTGRSRILKATHVYANSAAGTERELRGDHQGWWSDTTTNITSLVIDFDGGTFTGTVILKTMQF